MKQVKVHFLIATTELLLAHDINELMKSDAYWKLISVYRTGNNVMAWLEHNVG